MSRCSKKCNELKEKIDSISGLDDDFVYKILCQIENQIELIDIYANLDEYNGSCFSKINRRRIKDE